MALTCWLRLIFSKSLNSTALTVAYDATPKPINKM